MGRARRTAPALAPARRLAPLLAAAATLAAALPAPAHAVCIPVSATPMIFTNFTPFGPGVAATSTISYRCVGHTTTATLAISTPRTMTAGAGTLQLELYQDAGRTAVFPGAPPVPLPVVGTGTVTVYGFLPPQDAAPGSYATRLTVSLTSNRGTTLTTRLDVSTSGFVPSCVIQPAVLAFGDYDPLSGTPRDAQGTITVTCTRASPYAVALGPGANAAGGTRQMASGASRLRYQLYSDPGRTTVWDTVSTVAGTAASTAPISLVVYGRIPSGQAVAAGAYGDVVQSTINF